MSSKGKRKKPRPTNPNPLFCRWLTEWKNEADANGWKSVYNYSLALSSLKKYPLTLKRGKDCKILMHIGDKICSMLDKKLDEHLAGGGSLEISSDEDPVDFVPPIPKKTSSKAKKNKPATSTSQIPESSEGATSSQASTKRSRSSSRRYVPSYRSGAYALLITLQRYIQVEKRGDYLNKADLVRLAQPLTDVSFTMSEKGSHYTAFSSMKTLTSKGLVEKYSNPAKYKITEEGSELAASLVDKSEASTSAVSRSEIPSTSQADTEKRDSPVRSPKAKRKKKTTKGVEVPSAFTDTQIASTSQRPAASSNQISPAATSSTPLYTLQPHQYDILLVVDSREHFGFGKDKQQILPSLNRNGVKFDVRPLSVGDFLWIAKENAGERREVVLDYIIERKRLDDLSSSILDGRYKEQKLRMKQSGLRKPIYLVEYYVTQANARLKEDALLQSVMNTQIIDEFYVKRSDGLKDSIAYITLLHNQILKLYQGKTIHAYSQSSLPELPFNPADSEMCHTTYADFNSSGVKSKASTIKESWKRILMCIPGVSLDKANVIVEKYPTPSSLIESYNKCQDSEKYKLLSSLKFGAANRRFGDTLSRTICTMFHSTAPLP